MYIPEPGSLWKSMDGHPHSQPPVTNTSLASIRSRSTPSNSTNSSASSTARSRPVNGLLTRPVSHRAVTNGVDLQHTTFGKVVRSQAHGAYEIRPLAWPVRFSTPLDPVDSNCRSKDGIASVTTSEPRAPPIRPS